MSCCLCLGEAGRAAEGGKGLGLYFVNNLYWIIVDITTRKSNPAIKFIIPCF